AASLPERGIVEDGTETMLKDQRYGMTEAMP
ncbi:MAG: hypothetical protein HW398_312, partial [Acidobacteria bacterium]|nr:hypothetical protein [Acidobacteriota bacterium]